MEYLDRCCHRGRFAVVELMAGRLAAPGTAGERTTQFAELHESLRTAGKISAAGQAGIARVQVRIDEALVEAAHREPVEDDLHDIALLVSGRRERQVAQERQPVPLGWRNR
uniref:(northern house mosquito) hypothetical protein n=1 Tax=Culex pipiens TaxID=7175 RepID=A0A8D8C1L7_CULPI